MSSDCWREGEPKTLEIEEIGDLIRHFLLQALEHRESTTSEMKAIPLNAETEALARRLVWFESAADSLGDPIRFMAYAFARATHEDMKILRTYLDDDDFREALDKAPPGVIDPRSWAYWNLMMGRYPAPPSPKRKFDETDVKIEEIEAS
jgi:hypothetical protein